MLIGNGAKRLEQRIANALYSGSLHDARELGLLQTISCRIERYGERAFICDAQASWLFTILTTFEQETSRRPAVSRTPRKPAAAYASETAPEGFDITEALSP